MERTAAVSDRGMGLGLLFGLVAVGGALVALVLPGGLAGAWGFAAAMVAAMLSVLAIQLYL
jgi:hypothetical protein